MRLHAITVFLIGVLSFTAQAASPFQEMMTDFAGHTHRAFNFSQPFSGTKVDHYEVALEFPRNQREKYLIPDDCHKVINKVSYGSAKPVNIIDRNLWMKVVNDCRYVSVIPNNPQQCEHDFVSQYDYFNAKLSDLPFSSECDPAVSASAECMSQPTKDKLSISSFFPFLEVAHQTGQAELEECKFTDGMFRGKLVLTEDGIRCQKDRRAHGLRLLSVDHGDLNNDGYEDVVLRIMPLGRGVSRLPVLLPLTRNADDVPFSVPEGISMDFMAGY